MFKLCECTVQQSQPIHRELSCFWHLVDTTVSRAARLRSVMRGMCYATFRLRSARVRCATYPRGFGWRAYTLRHICRAFVTSEVRFALALVETLRAEPTLPECLVREPTERGRGLPKQRLSPRIVFSVLFYDLVDSWVYLERGSLLILSSCLSLKWVLPGSHYLAEVQ